MLQKILILFGDLKTVIKKGRRLVRLFYLIMNFSIINHIYYISDEDLIYFPKWFGGFKSDNKESNFLINIEVKPDLLEENHLKGDFIGQKTFHDVKNNKYHRYFRINNSKKLYDSKTVITDKSVRIFITPEVEEILLQNPRWTLTLLCLDILAICHQGIILHSSNIEYNGYSILFSAPSGIGKSTQANLWANYLQASLVNGDRAGLFFENNKIYSCGLPISGSSNIWENITSPLKAIVILKQSKFNNLTLLSAAEAFKELWSEVNFDRQDSNSAEFAADFLTKVISCIPIYRLENCADEESVRLLHDELFTYASVADLKV